ncbi:fluoride efflux transporter FluC [Campylobacter anatolicus]|uniref:fluoride efflux transporter FluC n=1 Tax=Campylobacter anatolicus TaxID=2829105 RepID=UPI001E4DDB9A|nr:CrcB family protein [Campylobacter anatolicus]
MLSAFYVGFGGFLGAILRYFSNLIFLKFTVLPLPLSTLFVNILGGFCIGFLLNLQALQNVNLKLFLITGLLGGFTTFSAFTNESLTLFLSQSPILAIFNIILNVLLCLMFCYIGTILAVKF